MTIQLSKFKKKYKAIPVIKQMKIIAFRRLDVEDAPEKIILTTD